MVDVNKVFTFTFPSGLRRCSLSNSRIVRLMSFLSCFLGYFLWELSKIIIILCKRIVHIRKQTSLRYMHLVMYIYTKFSNSPLSSWYDAYQRTLNLPQKMNVRFLSHFNLPSASFNVSLMFAAVAFSSASFSFSQMRKIIHFTYTLSKYTATIEVN